MTAWIRPHAAEAAPSAATKADTSNPLLPRFPAAARRRRETGEEGVESVVCSNKRNHPPDKPGAFAGARHLGVFNPDMHCGIRVAFSFRTFRPVHPMSRRAGGCVVPVCVAATVANIHAIAVNALGRIQHAPNPDVEQAERREVSFVMDAGNQQVVLAGQPVVLRVTEFRVLQLLANAPNRIFTRAEILEGINVGDYAVSERAVDVQIVSLRRKLGSAASRIETVRGQGYRFRDPPPSSSTS